jgi:uncharacterized protein YlxW (UPF0749 family)
VALSELKGYIDLEKKLSETEEILAKLQKNYDSFQTQYEVLDKKVQDYGNRLSQSRYSNYNYYNQLVYEHNEVVR